MTSETWRGLMQVSYRALRAQQAALKGSCAGQPGWRQEVLTDQTPVVPTSVPAPGLAHRPPGAVVQNP